MIIFVAILEADDGIKDLAIRAVSGPRPLIMPILRGAMPAVEGGFMDFQRGIGITATLAKRTLDGDGVSGVGFRPGKG